MKQFAFLLFALVSFLFSSICDAQLEKENQLGLSYMLSFGGVEGELQMTAEQSEELVGYSMNVQAELRQAFENFGKEFSRNLPGDEQDALKNELKDAIEKIRDKEQARLNDVLLPSQVKRLKEVRIQFFQRHHSDGLEAIRKELDLSSKQVSRMKNIREDFQQKIKQMRAANSGGEKDDESDKPKITLTPRELNAKIARTKEEAKTGLMAVLTGKQQQRLRKLEGEKYEFQTSKTNTEQE